MSDVAKSESARTEDHASPLAALQDEIYKTQDAQKSRSLLRWAIDGITSPYHHSSEAFANLEQLANRLNAGGDKDLAAAETTQINKAIAANRAAKQKEQDAYGIASGVVKTVGMFTPGRLGFLVAGAAFTADEVKYDDPRFMDAALGLTKGLGSRAVALTIAGRGFNPASMTLGLGISGRALDAALTRSNYLDPKTGDMSMSSVATGLLRVGERTFDPQALAVDAATAGLSYGLIKSTGGLLAGNRFRTVATTGFLTGYASGMTEEVSRERQNGQFDTSRLIAYPLARAASSAVASLPGAQRQYANNWPWEQAARTRDAEYKLVAISGADVQRIAAQKTPTNVTVKPVGDGLTLGTEETMHVGQQKVPIDWISLVNNKITGTAQAISDAPDQLRFVSRPITAPGATPQPWSMVVRPGFRSVQDLVSSELLYTDKHLVAPLISRFTEPATRFIGSGSYSGAILLANGAVMKVTRVPEQDLPSTRDWGNAPDDAKQLHSLLFLSTRPTSDGAEHIFASLQEYVKTPTTYPQAEALRDEMQSRGWKLTDYTNESDDYYPHKQVGINGIGKTVVIDYGARKKITE